MAGSQILIETLISLVVLHILFAIINSVLIDSLSDGSRLSGIFEKR